MFSLMVEKMSEKELYELVLLKDERLSTDIEYQFKV